MKTLKWAAALVAVLALVASGCGDDDDDDSGTEVATSTSETAAGPRLAEQWAGKVEGTDSYISVFTLDDGQTGAYLADGKEVAVLALGTLEGGQLDLSSDDGSTVTGTAEGERASGTVSLDGQEYSFSADRATGDAGWYRGRTSEGGEAIAAGYIILADGSQRGAVRRGDEVIAAPRFDPANPKIQVPGVGALEVLSVAEFVVAEGGLS